MADVLLSPTLSRLLTRMTLGMAQTLAPEVAPPGGLYPMRLAAYSLDEYRMMSGWPVSPPVYDVEALSSVSVSGEVVTFRDIPSTAEMNSLARWISDEDDTYDLTTLTWTPYRPSYDVTWQTSVAYAPTFINDYEYRMGSEKYFTDVINFDSDAYQHMWANLDPVIGGASGYSVIMAANLHSVYGDTDHSYTGIWCPGLPTPDTDTFTEDVGDFMSVTLRGETLYLETGQTNPTKVLPISDLLSKPQPCFFAFCFGRPSATLYAGTGPSQLRSATVFTGTAAPLSGQVVLGRSQNDRLHSADLAIMDLNIYGDQLSAEEVNAEVASLAAIYGGDQ